MSDQAAVGRRRRGLFADRRVKIALWIAVAEGIIVAIEEDFSRITAIVIAVPIILFHLLAGRTLESRLARDVSWTLALSQAFTVLVVILAWIVGLLALVLAGVFAAIALFLLLADRPARAE